jgi:hypothetical protein
MIVLFACNWMVLVITYITVLTNMTMQANFSGINSLTSFMYHWDLFSKVIIIRDIQLYFCRYPQIHVEIFIWWLVPLMEQFMYRVVNNQYLPSYFPFLTLCVSVRMPDEFIIFDDIFPLVTLWLRTEMGIWREG